MDSKLFKVSFTAIFLFFSIVSSAQNKNLSEYSRVSLITYDPGEEIYAIFGHSAIRIYDPVLKIDLTFNYGTFDFDTPNFYAKFVRGNLDYFLTISDYKRTLGAYIRENRTVKELVLNFDLKQRQKLYNDLLINYKPENRYYKYDFFFDNCATRIRDMFINAVDGKIELVEIDSISNLSYRELLYDFTKESPWLDLGINLALGLPSDQIAKIRGSMYLPEYLHTGFENARFIDSSNDSPLVSAKTIIFEAAEEDAASFSFLQLISPTSLFLLVLFMSLLLTYYEIRRKINVVCFDKVFFGITGILGWVVLLLWIGTEHHVMNNNLNILWAFPLHIFMIRKLRGKSITKFQFYYFIVAAIILLVLLLSWSRFPQQFHPSLIALILALFIRYLSIISRGIKVLVINKNVRVQ